MPTKIYVFPDLHYGAAKTMPGRKLNQPAQSLTNFRRVLHDLSPKKEEYVVLLGDMISKGTKADDLRHLAEVLAALQEYPARRLAVIGNHELHNCSKEEILDRLRAPRYHMFDVENARVVVLDTLHEGYRVFIDDEQLRWLEEAVRASDKPILVLSHAPLYPFDVTGNAWLATREQNAYVQNHREVERIIALASGTVVCVSGHVHANRCVRRGRTTHIALQSFSENITDQDDGPACQAYAVIDMDHDGIRVRVHNAPAEYTIPW